MGKHYLKRDEIFALKPHSIIVRERTTNHWNWDKDINITHMEVICIQIIKNIRTIILKNVNITAKKRAVNFTFSKYSENRITSEGKLSLTTSEQAAYYKFYI